MTKPIVDDAVGDDDDDDDVDEDEDDSPTKSLTSFPEVYKIVQGRLNDTFNLIF